MVLQPLLPCVVLQSALEEIQQFKPEDIDRISSSLLDNLPLSDKEKAEMSSGVQQVGCTGSLVTLPYPVLTGATGCVP